MSVNHTALGASAVNTRLTRSSCSGGPGLPPLPRRGLPNALHQPLVEQIDQAVRSVIGCPCAAASSDEQPVAELRVVAVGVEQRVGPVSLDEFAGGDRGGQPP